MGPGPARLCGGRTGLTQEGHSLYEEMGTEHPLSNCGSDGEQEGGSELGRPMRKLWRSHPISGPCPGP